MTKARLLHHGIDFGEGPRWHNGKLWFSDFYRGGVFTFDADGIEERVVSVAERPSGLGWMPDGTLLVVSMLNQMVLARTPAGDLRVHADLSDLVVGNCNDMVVSPTGHAYVGSFGFDLDNDEKFALGQLVGISPDGSAELLADDMMFPNGSVMTPDGSTLIVGETFGGRYSAFDVDQDGSLSNRRIWANVEGSAPDGCCLDAEGGIWMADVIGHRFARVVEGGEITDVIETEMSAVACALGGPDRRTLHMMCSPGTKPVEVAGKGASVILASEVDAPGWGLP